VILFRLFERIVDGDVQYHCQQITVTITQLLKLKDVREPVQAGERHFETRRAVIEENALHMLQCLRERLAYSSQIRKLEGPVIAYLHPLTQLTVLA
jgi:hypothetical protein